VNGLATFQAFVEEVRSRSDLVEIVGRDVQLRRAGSALKGLSPFHSEKHPSFVVWPTTQSWHDFSNGGGLGGDVFAYVQEHEKVSFKEAVFILAERAGVRRPNQDDESWRHELALAAERREVERVLTLAALYYHQCQPAEIRDNYFKGRYGFTDEIIDQLRLGWADGRLFEHLTTKQSVSRPLALKTGLFVALASGKVADFFQSRLVFPYWRGGRVVYFTARATQNTGTESWEQAKYKKLPMGSKRQSYISATVQNDYFYNEDAARGADELVITEGVPDCISAIQCGVACISPGTTSFRNKDLPRFLELTRNAKRIVICNDSEASGAGEAGAIAMAAALWEHGREVSIATIPLPEGTEKIDINDLVVAQGADAFREVVAAATPYPEFLLRRIPADAPKSNLDRLLKPVLASLAGRSSLRADPVIDAIVERFAVRRSSLTEQMRTLASGAKASAKKGGSTADARTPGRAPGATGAAPPARPATPGPSDGSHDGRPQIRVNDRQLRDVIADTWGAVRVANRRKLQLFVKGGALVRLVRGDDGPFIELMSEAGAYGYLARIADWVKVTEDAVRDVSPVHDVARDILVYPHTELPQIEAVAATPVFDSDGGLVSTHGYHPHARLWYRQDALQIGTVPERPTSDEVAAARSLLLDDLLVDFPFTADSDRAHALGALLLPFVRRMVIGCTPIHLIEAPTPGSGKGLLADIVSILCVGRACDPTTITRDEDETRKKITSLLLKAQPVILVDNIKDGVDSAQLAAAITAERWSDRILGHNRMLDLPNRGTWIVTGNNPNLSLEIARRCVRVRIDAKVDQPWKRTGFKHHPIRGWVKTNRAQLVHALVVLARGWIAAGSRPGSRDVGSFESWAGVVGGILEHASVPGFLDDTDQLYEAADADGQEWREFVSAWWHKFGPRWLIAGDLLALALEKDLLGSIVRDKTLRGQKIRLGKALSTMRDRQFANYRLLVGRNSNVKVAQYRLVDTTAGEAGSTAAGEQLSLDAPGDRPVSE
jgi:DNA primase catalytic core